MGEIEGDMEKNALILRRFGRPQEVIDLNEEGGQFSGHGGGDFGLMSSFCKLIAAGGTQGLTGVDASVESHVMALAAEASRLDGGGRAQMGGPPHRVIKSSAPRGTPGR